MMENSEITDYLRNLAEEFTKEKRYDDAVLLYRKLVNMRPGDDSFLLALAWACHDAGMQEEAIGCFEQLLALELERDVFTGFAFDELVRILKKDGDYERLVEICKRVVAKLPDDICLLGDLGEAYLKAGNADKAVEVFEKITEMEPDASMALCSLGNARIAAGNFDGAESAYKRAVEIDPMETGTYYNRLSQVYFEAGHNERAEAALRRCIEYRPDEPAYHLSLGDILIRQGRLSDATVSYEKAVELNRQYAGAYYNRLGNTLAKTDYHLQAVDIFEKAIAVDPGNPFYYLRLAESYTAIGLPDMAEKARREAESLK